MGTYHADYPLLRFPIDHVFLSDGFRVSDLSTYKVTGSDHIGVAAGVVAEDPDQGVSPEPEGDDEEEAKKIVDEGKDDAAQRDVLDSQGEVSP